MIREIFKADINLLHLTIRAVAFGGLTFLIMFLLIPLNFMLMFGAGVSGDRLANTTLAKSLWLLSGFIVLTPFAIYRIRANFKRGNLSKAKDYMLVIMLTLILSIAFYLWYN
jgi:hypothetical protein